ncbi:MAG: hypothetical protein ACFFDK_17850 [Promethearchaeota archaeon]
MEEIDPKRPSHNVFLDAFHAVASLGVHIKALKAGLFDTQAWQKREDIERNIEALNAFLWKEIR